MGHAELTIQEQAASKRISLDEYWMPFTPNRDFKSDPHMVVRAEGMYLWNDKGDKIIDASSGLFCVSAGHGRKEIADAVGAQLRELDFCAPFLRAHPKQFELATRVAELTPGDLNRIFFVNSGSEAVDTAMKIALAYHQARGQGARNMFVSRERAYHGVGFGGVALVRARQQPAQVRHRPSRRGAHAPHAPQGKLLHEGRRRAGRRARRGSRAVRDAVRRREHRGVLRRADRRIERLPRAAEGISQAPPRDLRRERHPARVRRSDLRVWPHRPELRRPELRRHPRPADDGEGTHQRLAADGRRGGERAHPRHDHGRRCRGHDRAFPRLYVLGHPASCAAGLATLDIYKNDGLFEKGRQLSPYFLDAIFSLRDMPVVSDIRGYGMFATVDVHPDGGPGKRGHIFQKKLFANGLNLKTTGDSAIIAPPLIAEKKHVDEIADILRRTLKAL
jgi:beta-alanine--pyruvate transaminase